MSIVADIKSEAQGNRTKIQSSDAAELEGILNNLFYLPRDIDRETEFIRQVMTRGQGTQERTGLHASALIVGDAKFCLRQQVLSLVYQQLQGEQISVGLKRIFEEGNAVHEKWQRMFLRAGFSDVQDLDVTQYAEFDKGAWAVSFTPDIICRIPQFYDGKMIGEIKSVNTYQYQKMVKHPSASKQCQLYMLLSGIHKGFVLSEDKNTQDFKLEVFDFDEKAVEVPLERMADVTRAYKRLRESHKMAARPADAKGSDCKRCKECPMRDACWNVGEGRKKLEV